MAVIKVIKKPAPLPELKSRRPPSIEQLAKREQLKAEIAAMRTSLSEAELADIREKIRGRQRWFGLGF